MNEEDTYEFQCMRAELLDIEKPTLEEYEKMREKRLKEQQEELETAEAQVLDEQDENVQNAGTRLDELNSILSSTQQKLNRFKQTACSSITNIFGRSGSIDLGATGFGGSELTANTSISNVRRNTTVGTTNLQTFPSNDLEQIDEEEQQQQQQTQSRSQSESQTFVESTEKIRSSGKKMNIEKKMSSHLNKLDSLINKADNAEISMAEQTKQMRKMAK